MRQVLYLSGSLIGLDPSKHEELTDVAAKRNAANDITGLLWTDGRRFAQVLEGALRSISGLLERIRADEQHTNFRMICSSMIMARQFGDWSMIRPKQHHDALTFSNKMVRHLVTIPGSLASDFQTVISSERRCTGIPV